MLFRLQIRTEPGLHQQISILAFQALEVIFSETTLLLSGD